MTNNIRFGKKHWKEFGQKELEIIRKERDENYTKLKALNMGKHCPACNKPNSINVDFCTGCNFTLLESDIVKLPSNIFLDIIEGRYTKTPILFRSKELLLFNDKFGVNIRDDHLDVIPVKVIADIKSLNKSHIPLLKKLYQAGIDEFKKRTIKHIPKTKIEDNLISGFNFPVSVKHLHVHMVLPPFKHRKVFQYPRWHSYKKVIDDLTNFGKVKLYCDHPNDKEGKEEYDRAIKLHEKYVKKLGIVEEKKEEKK